MNRFHIAVSALVLVSLISQGQEDYKPVVVSDEAMRIHQKAIVFDGHNDLPGKIRQIWNSDFSAFSLHERQERLHTDIPRLIEGGLGAQFWSAYVPASTIKTGNSSAYALEQIDLILRMVEAHTETFEMAYTASDIVRIRQSGKIASLIGIEGGHAIENSLALLRMYYQLGARYLTLTHSDTLDWADSATDEELRGGLTEFGEDVIREMNRLGMLIDVSHVSHETMRDVLRVAKAPVIASHSSAYAIAASSRNVPDDVLEMIAENGGVVMVNFFSGYIHPEGAKRTKAMFDYHRRINALEDGAEKESLENQFREWRDANPAPRGTVRDVVDHIDNIVKVAGIDHAGLGSDYDGVSQLPVQLEDVSTYPFITQELLTRGYGEQDIIKILGGNAIRALSDAEEAAKKLREE